MTGTKISNNMTTAWRPASQAIMSQRLRRDAPNERYWQRREGRDFRQRDIRFRYMFRYCYVKFFGKKTYSPCCCCPPPPPPPSLPLHLLLAPGTVLEDTGYCVMVDRDNATSQDPLSATGSTSPSAFYIHELQWTVDPEPTTYYNNKTFYLDLFKC